MKLNNIVQTCFLFLFLVAVGSVFPGCSTQTGKANPKAIRYPIQIVCTTGQVADVVRQVGGKHLKITTLMEGDIDPHTYEASQDDISQLASADMIFYSGHHLEGKFDLIFKQMAKKKPTIALAEGIAEESLLREQSAIDPHIWFDTSLWSKTVPLVAEALSEFDPSHAADYELESKKYQVLLEELHEQTVKDFQSLPPQNRILVTAHDAFSYFARAYGFEVKSIQGISTDSEPSLKEIESLVSFLVEKKVNAIFVEKTVSDENVKAVIEGARKQGQNVTIGGSLYSDSMGLPGTPEGTYVGMFRANVKTILEALSPKE